MSRLLDLCLDRSTKPPPRPVKSKTIRSLLILALVSLISGCAVIDESRVHDTESDTIPWNTRAGWEDNVIGVPY